MVGKRPCWDSGASLADAPVQKLCAAVLSLDPIQAAIRPCGVSTGARTPLRCCDVAVLLPFATRPGDNERHQNLGPRGAAEAVFDQGSQPVGGGLCGEPDACGRMTRMPGMARKLARCSMG